MCRLFGSEFGIEREVTRRRRASVAHRIHFRRDLRRDSDRQDELTELGVDIIESDDFQEWADEDESTHFVENTGEDFAAGIQTVFEETLNGSILGLAGCVGDSSEEFSDGAFTIIPPYPEGLSTDALARRMGTEITEQTDANHEVEPRGGASSLRGTGELFNPRLTKIFEGTSEIQQRVIADRLFERGIHATGSGA